MTNVRQGLQKRWWWVASTLGLSALLAGAITSSAGAAQDPLPVVLSQRLVLDAQPAQVSLPDGRTLTLTRDGAMLQLADAAQSDRVLHQWTLRSPRRLATLTMLPSGRVLLWGGVNESGQVQPSGLWWDPVRQTFQSANDVRLASRAGHTATVLTDGRLLITGGWSAGPGGTAQAQVWDERANTAAITRTSLMPPRLGHRASLEADGRVRFHGGIDTQGRVFLHDVVFDPDTEGFGPSTTVASLQTNNSPALAGSLPQSGEQDVSPQARLALRFTLPLRVTGLNDTSVSLLGPSGRTAIRVVAAEHGRVVFVTPAQALFPAAHYTLMMEGAYGANGRPLPLIAVDFRTAALAPDGSLVSPTQIQPADAEDAVRLMTGSDAGIAAGCDGQTLHPCAMRHSLAGGAWTPGQDNTASRWRIYGATPYPVHNAGMAHTAARYHVTVLKGRVLRVDEQPVADVEVSIGSHVAHTDANGDFLLFDAPAGKQELYVDGTTASNGKVEYGQFVVGVDIKAGQLTEMPYLMYLPRITARDKIRIPAPLTQETVLTHPDMPGLEIHLPAGAIIRDHKGRLVTELSIVPTPVNRAPFPVAENYPMYFTLEPGGAVIQGLTPEAAKGVRIVYPNYDHYAPGTVSNFWIYNPLEGWRVYGSGKVSPDGRQFIPEEGVALYQTMGGSYNVPVTDPPTEKDQPNDHPPCGCDGTGTGGGATAGDPIDLRTGAFTTDETDIGITDVMAIGLSRHYRQHDNVKRSFGIGTASNYDYTLNSIDYSVMSLVMPNGTEVKFDRYSGAGACGEWHQNGSPTQFEGAVLVCGSDAAWSYGYWMTLRSGTKMFFGAAYHNSGKSPLRGMIDRNGNRLDLTYDAGLLTRITSPSGRTITLTYDTGNRVATAQDAIGRTWSYTYTSDLLTKVTYPDGTYKTIAYDTFTDASITANPDHIGIHRIASVTNRRGIRELLNEYVAATSTAWVTDGAVAANLRKVSKQTLADGTTYVMDYAHSDGTTTGVLVTQPDGSKRRVVFDNGRRYPKSETVGYGSTQAQTFQFERDAYDRLTARTDPLGRRTEYEYDSAGQVIKTTYLAGTPDAKVVRMAYTVDGDLSRVTDAVGRVTTLSYFNRCLTSITDPLNRTSQITCNSNGQPLTITDAAGNITTYHYDGPEMTAVVDPLGRATGFAYDTLGRLVAVRSPDGRISHREYDSNGRIKKTYDPSGNATELSYDAEGNLAAVLLPHGNGVTYTYDSRDHLSERRDALNQPEAWTYDAMGRVATYTDRKQQVIQYVYDVLGRPTTTTYADGSTQTATYDAGNRLLQLDDSAAGTLSWQYDVFNHVLQAAAPEGTVNYEYDTVGRRTGMTAGSQPKVEYQYDAADQVTRILQGSEVVDFQYDVLGRRTQLTLPNGVKTGYAYDAASQLTGLAYVKADNSLIGDLGYAYNTAGQRTTQTGSLASDLLPAASSNNTFDDNNRQTQYQGQALAYDANGNLTNDGARTYTWNARNQLIDIQQGSQNIAHFEYDAIGRRKVRTEGTNTTTYLYDGQDAVQETRGASVLGILTGLGIDERFARGEANNRSYFLADALGSTRELMDSSGNVVQRYDYTPYGQAQASNANLVNPYQYTGRELDDSGLYYYRARYYHPGMGRFVSEDPLRFNGGDWNTYAYVGGDPIAYVDRLGLESPARACGGGPGSAAWAHCAEVPHGSNSMNAQIGLGITGAGLLAVSGECGVGFDTNGHICRYKKICTSGPGDNVGAFAGGGVAMSVGQGPLSAGKSYSNMHVVEGGDVLTLGGAVEVDQDSGAKSVGRGLIGGGEGAFTGKLTCETTTKCW